jgi:hypothetical protein
MKASASAALIKLGLAEGDNTISWSIAVNFKQSPGQIEWFAILRV